MGKGEKHTADPKDTLAVPMTRELKSRVRAYSESLGKEMAQVGRAAIESYLDSPEAQLRQVDQRLAELHKGLMAKMGQLESRVWRLERNAGVARQP